MESTTSLSTTLNKYHIISAKWKEGERRKKLFSLAIGGVNCRRKCTIKSRVGFDGWISGGHLKPGRQFWEWKRKVPGGTVLGLWGFFKQGPR